MEKDTTATDPIEPEVVDDKKAELERRRDPAVPSTFEELAALGPQGEELIKFQHGLLRTLRWASLQETMPQDWLLFKDPEGNVTGYLQDKGCQRIMSLWGIEVYPKQNEPYPIGEGDDRGYAIDGDSFCKRTGEQKPLMKGVAFLTDDFLQGKKGLKSEEYTKLKAAANLHGRHTRKHTGLNSVPEEELNAAWAANPATKWKTTAKCSHGKGFGGKAERHGAQIQQSEIEPQYQPKCSVCNETMKFIPPGKTQAGKPYNAFWSCSKNRDHKPNITHEQALAEAKRMTIDAEKSAESREPGDE